MKERPILFSGPMVNAILNGTKTQTRRIVKHPHWGTPETMEVLDGRSAWAHDPMSGGDREITCPYGQPGDVLWVREALQRYGEDPGTAQYAATMTGVAASPPGIGCDPSGRALWGWKRSMITSRYMPKWACRLRLNVTAVRIERLQDITYGGVIREGLTHWLTDEQQTDSAHMAAAIDDFARVWDQINGKRAPWDSNPWVWVVAFETRKGKP